MNEERPEEDRTELQRIYSVDWQLRFNAWYKKINNIVLGRYGLDLADLADMPFADSFDAGITPSQFVSEYVADALIDSL